MTLKQLTICAVLMLPAFGCRTRSATAPSVPPSSTLSLEAEAGMGQGDQMVRTSASGGLTIHLAPGQRRQWAFKVVGPGSEYSVMVRYSNDETGDSEIIRATIDGRPTGGFRAQDTGDNGAGWELFASDHAGAAVLPGGAHTLVIDSSGGDGCIEIDRVTLVPAQSGG
jgi:hypothetical protein